MGHWRKIIVSGSDAELNTITASNGLYNNSIAVGGSGVQTTINGGTINAKDIILDTNLTVAGSIIGTATTASTIKVTGSSTSANFPITFVSQTASNGLPLFADDNITINPTTNQLTVGSGAVVVGNTTISSLFTNIGENTTSIAELRLIGTGSISASNNLFLKTGGNNTRLSLSASGQMSLGATLPATNILLNMAAVPGAIYTAAPGNTSVIGFYNNLSWSGSTGGTANVLNYASYARTAVGSILSNFWNFRVEENQFFGSSSNMYGYYCGSLSSARSASFGFYGLVNSSSIGARNYNLFMQGDAPNYLRGTLFVGNISGSTPREMVYIRPTGSNIDTSIRIQNTASSDLFTIGSGNSNTNVIFHSSISSIRVSASAQYSSNTTASFQGTINFATNSIAPTTGVEGDFEVAQNGANYFIYVYIGGRWRSSSLA